MMIFGWLGVRRVRRETAEAGAESVWEWSDDGKLESGHFLRRAAGRYWQTEGEEEEKEEG